MATASEIIAAAQTAAAVRPERTLAEMMVSISPLKRTMRILTNE
jgi:hypothetical protein